MNGLRVLALDAANPQLVREWAADGTLPHLGAWMRKGLVGETENIEGFFVGSTWTSMYTGVTPARHGMHSLVQLRPGTYELQRRDPHGLVRHEPFWNALGRAGRRVAILDVPLAGLSAGLHGVQTVEWGSHDAVFGFRTWPADLAGEIERRYGRHPGGTSCDGTRRSSSEYSDLVERLRRGVGLKTELTRLLLDRGPWDFFMQVFTESHCVGHQCWHFHEPRHPAHDPAAAAVVGNPVRDVYVAIDAAIGELARDMGDTRLVLLIAHGMSWFYGAQFLLPEILFRLGRARSSTANGASEKSYPLPVGIAARGWHGLPDGVKRRLAPLRRRFGPSWERGDQRPGIGVDPRSSRCFVVDNGLAVGGIRLNLVGREPHGVLRPGHDADRLCDELARELLQIVDKRNGKPLIRRVLRTAERYRGPCLDELPDLLVEWSDELPTGSAVVGTGDGAAVRAQSSAIGVLEGINRYGRTGEHRPGGLLIAAGPGIGRGVLDRPVSILDLAPTFARMLDVELSDVDGRPIPELIG